MSAPTRPASFAQPRSRERGRPVDLAGAVRAASLAVCLLAAGIRGVDGQAAPGPSAVEVGLLLRQADGIKRVLMIGAHPDDEDTSLLAFLSRTLGAEATYLSLTRGEGGQNRIGDEIGEDLGILRSEELLAARRLDGAAQRFSRAYDFGYSRSAAETLALWGEEEILSDVVRVIRELRPQVVISIFRGDDRDGHGHHQAAGRLARTAVVAAANPARFPEQIAGGLRVWRTPRLYRHDRRSEGPSDVEVRTGSIDPLLGRSAHQLAMESRSLHRSQSFGTVQDPGAHVSRLTLVSPAEPDGPPSGGLFAGVDTTLAGALPDAAADTDVAVGRVRRYRELLAAARRELRAERPAAILPRLLSALEALAAIPRTDPDAAEVLDTRTRLLTRATLTAAGIRFTARTADPTLVPGQRVRARVEVWNGGERRTTVGPPEFDLPAGWRIEPFRGDEPFPEDPGPFGGTRSLPLRIETEVGPDGTATLPPGAVQIWDVVLTVPEGAGTTGPYYLTSPREGARYAAPDPELRTLPFEPSHLEARVAVRLEEAPGRSLEARTILGYRGLDRDSGQYWRVTRVLPRGSVSLDPTLALLPTGAEAPLAVRMLVRSLDPEGIEGQAMLETPRGWKVEPTAQRVALTGEGRDTTLRFAVRPPAGSTPAHETARLLGQVVLRDRDTLRHEVRWIEHPHIRPRPRTLPAALEVVPLTVRVARRSVGYVPGPARNAGRAMRRLGVPFRALEAGDWTRAALDSLDVIVIGIRAYETRADLRAANPMLLDWVRRGGVLIVQYQRYDLMGRDFAPFPLDFRRPPVRVTDENAEVTLLAPDSPALTIPNRIGMADFDGWVQERATFAPRTWDDRVRALVASADPDEAPVRGGLLIADVGDGLYVHVTLSLFRQWEAGVPGAYRLFANLLSLDPTARTR